MRDQDEGVLVSLEVLFQPVAAFQIEMVRRLIEQQQRRLLQQELGQRNAHLPAAGELFGAPGPIFFAESQPAEHGADLGVERVDIVGVQVVSNLRVPVGGRGVLLRLGVCVRKGVR